MSAKFHPLRSIATVQPHALRPRYDRLKCHEMYDLRLACAKRSRVRRYPPRLPFRPSRSVNEAFPASIQRWERKFRVRGKSASRFRGCGAGRREVSNVAKIRQHPRGIN